MVRNNENIDLMAWWQYLVKAGIKKLAQNRGKIMKKQRLGQLKILQVRQAFLAAKISLQHHLLTELTLFNMRISA